MAGKEDNIKTTIELDGEKDYKNACKDIDAALRKMSSEMKYVTAEYANNQKSTEALTAKKNVLQNTLEQQSEKVKYAEEALKNLSAAGREGTPEFNRMEIALNTAKTAMTKTQTALEGVTQELNTAASGSQEYKDRVEAIDKSLGLLDAELKMVTAQYDASGDAADGAAAKKEVLTKTLEEQEKKVSELEQAYNQSVAASGEMSDESMELKKSLMEAKTGAYQTQGQMNELSKELEDSKSKWEGVGKVIENTSKVICAAMAAVGVAVVAAGKTLFDLGMDAAAAGDRVDKMSQRLGMSRDTFQEWDYVLSQSGMTIDNMKAAMNTMNGAMSSLAQEGDKGARTLGALGITIEDLDNLKQEEIFERAVKALQEMPEGYEKSRLAAELFGRQGLEMMPLLNSASGSIDELREKAHDLGMVMSDEAINASVAFTDSLDTLKRSFAGIKNAIGAELLPGFTSITEGITGLINGCEDAADKVTEGVQTIVDGISNALPQFLEVLFTMAAAIAKTAPAIITALVEGIINNLPLLIDAALELVISLVDAIINALPLLLDGAMQIILKLVEGIAAALPTLIPAIVGVVLQIVQTLIENIPLLIQAAISLIKGLVEGLIAAIPLIIAAIPEIITSFIDTLLSSIPLIIQAGIDLLVSLVDDLPDIITEIVEAIPLIIDGIINTVVTNIPLIVQAGIDLLVALVEALPTIIVTIVKALPQIITSIIDALLSNLPLLIQAGIDIFVALVAALPDIILGIIAAIPEIITAIIQAIIELIPKMIEAGKNLLLGLKDGFFNIIGNVVDAVKEAAGKIVDGIKGFLGIKSPSTVFANIGENMAAGVGQGFGNEMGGVENNMKGAIGAAGGATAGEAVNAVNSGIIKNMSQLDGAVRAVVERIITGLNSNNPRFVQQGNVMNRQLAQGKVSAIPEIAGKIPQIVQAIITKYTAENPKFTKQGDDFSKKIGEGMSSVASITGKISGIITAIINKTNEFLGEFKTAGENMAKGIWEGLESQKAWLQSKVKYMMEVIVKTVKNELEIKSPSRVFADIGKNMAAGMGVGFGDEMRKVQKSIIKATDDAVPVAPAPKNRLGRNANKGITIIQNIYTKETSYAAQQREATKNFRQVAREVLV